MNTGRIIGVILLSAFITFGLRALPFVIFKGDRELPAKVQLLGKRLPPAIMSVLIVYCLKDVRTSFMENGIWELVAVLVVAVSYKWKHNTFVSILLGTVVYMLLLAYT